MLWLKLLPTLVGFILALLEYQREITVRKTNSSRSHSPPVVPTLFLLATLASAVVIWSDVYQSKAAALQLDYLVRTNESLEEKVVFLSSELEKWKASRFTGRILPANEPRPPHNCGPIPDDSLALFFGNHVAWVKNSTNRIPLMSIGGQTVIELNRQPDGVYLSAIIFRSDGRGVATVVNNTFGINPNNYFENVSADPHELVIRDKAKIVVLRARFVNENTFQLTGEFGSPSGVLSITESGTTFGGATFSGECFAENVIGAGIFGF